MSSAVELHESRKLRREPTSGRITGSTRWLVTLDTTAQSPLSVTGLPTLGQGHPQEPSAIVDSYEVDRQVGADGLTYFVSPQYANFRDFSINTSLKIREETFAIGSVDIPYGILRPTSFASPGTVPIVVWVWEFQRIRRERKQQLVTVKLFRTGYGQADADAIASQYGKYHFLSPAQSGAPYKFVGADIRQIKTTWWQFVYSWATEEFISTTTVAQQIADYVAPSGPSGASILFPSSVLAPFEEYFIVPSTPFLNPTNNAVQPSPQISRVRKYANSDVTGYAGAASLPGAPV